MSQERIAQLRAEADRLRDEAVALALQSQQAREQGNFDLARQFIARANSLLDQADSLKIQAGQLEKEGVTSTGQTTANATQARDDGANTQNPPTPPTTEQDGTVKTAPATTTPTNADPSVSATPNEVAAPPTLPGGAKANNAPVASPSTTPINPSNSGLIQPTSQSRATQSYIYKAIEVTSIFERGRFTQELEGRLLIFPIPPVTGSATSRPVTTDADTNRTSEANESTGRGTPQTNTDTRSAQARPQVNRSRVTTPSPAGGNSLAAEFGGVDSLLEATGAVAPLTSTPPSSNGQGVALRNQNIPSGTTRGNPDQKTQQGNREY